MYTTYNHYGFYPFDRVILFHVVHKMCSNKAEKLELSVSKNQQSVVAMAWYENPVIYRTARSIMSDKASLPVAYLDWRQLAVRNCKMIEAAGNRVERVLITPAVFRDWARSSGHDHDAQGRQAFAQWMLDRPAR
jgi:hypothetical protein